MPLRPLSPGRVFRAAALVFAAALACGPQPAAGASGDEDRHAVRITSLAGDLYAVEGQSVLLHMPRCLRGAHQEEALIDLEARAVWFDGAAGACAIHRLMRAVDPTPGLYDLRVTSRFPDIYESEIHGWKFQTESCDAPAKDALAKAVIDGRGDRLLITAPEHPNASITGRVTCAIVAVFTELAF